jgi:hypothetical protein
MWRVGERERQGPGVDRAMMIREMIREMLHEKKVMKVLLLKNKKKDRP